MVNFHELCVQEIFLRSLIYWPSSWNPLKICERLFRASLVSIEWSFIWEKESKSTEIWLPPGTSYEVGTEIILLYLDDVQCPMIFPGWKWRFHFPSPSDHVFVTWLHRKLKFFFFHLINNDPQTRQCFRLLNFLFTRKCTLKVRINQFYKL